MMSEKGMRTLVTVVSTVLAVSGMAVVAFFLWMLFTVPMTFGGK